MSDSQELLDAITAARERLVSLETFRPTCPDCFDRGWTKGGTPCGCQFSPAQYRRRVVK